MNNNLKKFKFFIKGNNKMWAHHWERGAAVWFKEYHTLRAAKSELTKTVNAYVKTYGEYPESYGVADVTAEA